MGNRIVVGSSAIVLTFKNNYLMVETGFFDKSSCRLVHDLVFGKVG